MNFEGIVSFNGRPAGNVTVKFFHHEPGKAPNELSSTYSNVRGEYSFSLSPPSPSVFFIEATTTSGEAVRSRPQLVATGSTQTVNLELKTGENASAAAPKIDMTSSAITALGGTVNVADLSDDDLSVVQLANGLSASDTRRLRDAELLSPLAGVDAEILFALGKEFTLDAQSLSSTPRSALRAAMERGRAEGDFADAAHTRINAALDALASWSWSVLKDVVVPTERYSLKKLFDTAGLASTASGGGMDEQEAVATLLLKHEGSADEFWARVNATSTTSTDPEELVVVGLDTVKKQRLRGLTELAQFTSFQWDLVTALDSEGKSDVAALSAMSRSDWQAKINNMGVPGWAARVGIEPATYALELYAQLEDRFPTAALNRTFAANTWSPDLQPAATFLTGPSSFDIFANLMHRASTADNTNAAQLDTDLGTQFVGDSQAEEKRAALRADIERIQRLLRVAPRGYRNDLAAAAFEAGYTSCAQIGAQSVQAFIGQMRPFIASNAQDVPDMILAQMHAEASQRSTIIAASAWDLASPAREIPVLPPQLRDVTTLPNYTDLFGPASACQCTHCQSMLSPSAYLVDLLQWLKSVPVDSGQPLLAALKSSHAHITALKLSCKNANTQLPLIDLVIEQLEHRLVPAGFLPPETIGDTPTLRAYPQYLNAAAYDDLQARVYPPSLPFDLAFEEIAAYSAPLGEPFADMLQVLNPTFNAQWAQAQLGINPKQWAVISTEDTTKVAARWGVSEPVDLVALSQVNTLMSRLQATGQPEVDFDTVLDLLRSTHVQGAGQMGVWISDTGCDLSQANVTGLSLAALDRMQRLLRLSRLTGWRIEQIDRVASSGLSDYVLIEMARIQRLSTLLAVDLDELLDWLRGVPVRSWHSRLQRGTPSGASGDGQGWVYDANHGDAGGPDSRYAQIFLAPGHALPNPLALDATAQPSGMGQPYTSMPALLSALKITEADVPALLPWVGATLDMYSLMAINTHAGLARALRLRPTEYFALRQLTGMHMMPSIDIVTIEQLVDAAKVIQRAGMTPSTLADLLFFEPISEEAVGKVHARIHDTTQALRQAGTILPDDPLSLVIDKFESALPDEKPLIAIARWAQLNDGSAAAAWPEAQAKLNALNAQLDPDVDFSGLATQPYFTGSFNAHAFLADAHALVIAPQQEQRYRQALVEAIGLEFKLDAELIEAILDRLQPQHVLKLTDEPNGPVDQDVVNALRSFEYATRFITHFDFNAADMPWVLEKAKTQGGLDLLQPSTEELSTSSGMNFRGWRALQDAAEVRAQYAGGIFDLLYAYNPNGIYPRPPLSTDAAAELAARGGWRQGDVELLAQKIEEKTLGNLSSVDWQSPAPLVALTRMLQLGRRIGANASQLISLVDKSNATEKAAKAARYARAETIKALSASRRAPDEWLEQAADIRDGLRIKQRDALADAVMVNPSIDDINALSAQMLVDVLTGPCQLTSRTKNACSQVQSFINRTLLGLEAQQIVDADPAQAGHEDARTREAWRWMKLYRIWEANRKVFLYPENWLEPGLHPDPSHLYEQFEAALKKGPLTHEIAEQAVLDYVRAFAELGELEIVASCQLSNQITHLIGRTRARPYRFFHRQHTPSGWRPWQPLDLPISDKQVFARAVFKDGFEQLWLGWVHWESNGIDPEEFVVGSKQSPINAWLGHSVFDGRIWSASQETEHLGGSAGSLRLGRAYDGLLDPAYILLFSSFEVVVDPDEPIGEQGPLKAALVSRGGPAFIIPQDGTGTAQRRSHGMDRRVFSVLVDEWDSFESGVDRGIEINSPLETNSGALIQSMIPLKHQNLTFKDQRYPLGRSVDAQATRRILYEEHKKFMRLYGDEVPFFEDALVEVARAVDTNQPGVEVVPEGPEGQYFSVFLGDGEFKIRLGYFSLRPTAEVLSFPTFTIESRPSYQFLGERRLLGWRFDERSTATTIADRIDEAGCAVVLEDDTPATLCFLGFERPVARLDHRFCKKMRTAAALGVKAVYTKGKDPLQQSKLNLPVLEASLGVADSTTFNFSGGPFAQYHWELFYHLPLKIADVMREQQRYQDAQRWLHFIFDPTLKGSVQNKWLTKPLRAIFSTLGQESEPSLRGMLQAVLTGDGELADALEEQVTAWANSPFDPHTIARMRPVSYAKRALFAYLELLIDWADQLFRRDTIESTTEAGELYRLAVELLGKPTQSVPKGEATTISYDELGDLDALSNTAVLENHIAQPRRRRSLGSGLLSSASFNARIDASQASEPVFQLPLELELEAPASPRPNRMIERLPPDLDLPLVGAFDEDASGPQRTYMYRYGDAPTQQDQQQLMIATGGHISRLVTQELPPSARWAPSLLFCTPGNEKLQADYYAVLADRLFKLRNCMNIDGVKRSLALFEPPIDPGLLVKARAAGIDIDDALAMQSARSALRYEACAAFAQQLVGQVRQFGQSLLSVLERQDGEALSQLRVGHEQSLNEMTLQTRRDERKTARETLASLKVSLQAAQARFEYYDGRDEFSGQEIAQLTLMGASELARQAAIAGSVAGKVTSTTLATELGWSGTGTHKVVVKDADRPVEGATRWADHLASGLATSANIFGTLASYRRRKDDWDNLAEQAKFDIKNLKRQIIAAELRVAITEHEIDTQRLRMRQSREIADFLERKFTNDALYDWMAGTLKRLYFQSYNLAFDYARKAEKAWQFERVDDRSFVRYDAWSGLKQGLLAAEQLELDLNRMQAAWHENNRREYELTRHVSLLSLDPQAIEELRNAGSCRVALPESLFDMDAPGHYLRRIKSVALSLPSVTGPYVPVHCTLTLERSSLRVSPATDPNYPSTGVDDPRFVHDRTSIESIVTSQAQADAGLFEAPLNGARYLPFEGAGAVSQWHLKLPDNWKQFDYQTISDAILHLRYTAREGGAALRSAAVTTVNAQMSAPSAPLAAGQTASQAGALNVIRQTLKPTQLERYNANQEITIELEGVPYAVAQAIDPPNDINPTEIYIEVGGVQDGEANHAPVVTYAINNGVLSATITANPADPRTVSQRPALSLLRISATYGV